MKSFPLFLSLIFMIVSWAMGSYFLSVIYTPTIIVPLFNEFIWMRDYQGMLGLTTFFSLLTVPLITYMFKQRNRITKRRMWYSIAFTTHIFWLGTIAIQLKTVAFNLGICH
ncbi:hypothetical protein [Halobacillus sp. H74]|uniref:hypothetical protein n=1 Tax=Halobacillus sp. H74 TaxID=3457436 RepID=UPI003FCCA159